MLKLDDLSFRQGDFALAADLSVPGPGITAVIGPSGGGKSTLLSLIAGFAVPDRGRILWQDRDITGLAPGKRPVAMLFQDNNLFPHLDLVTNVALGASPRARPSAEARDKATEALSRVGLAGFEARRPSALSGGQQSRVALARLLLTDRPVVLMDEAFSALGPALRAEMLDMVTELLPEATMLMVTHDPDDAVKRAAWTIFIENGQVAAPRPTAEMFDAPSEALARYLHG